MDKRRPVEMERCPYFANCSIRLNAGTGIRTRTTLRSAEFKCFRVIAKALI